MRLAISETLLGPESSRRLGVKIGNETPDFDRFAFVRDKGLHMGGDSMYIEREIEQTIDLMLRQGKVVLIPLLYRISVD